MTDVPTPGLATHCRTERERKIMGRNRWEHSVIATALVLGCFASTPLILLLLDAPADLLASCGSYYDGAACAGCNGQDPQCSNPRTLCCILVRAPFHPKGCNDDPDVCCGGFCPPTWCGTLLGVNANTAGPPTADGTTGRGASPKYKSICQETTCFVGYVRKCGASPGPFDSTLCADGRAEVYLDGQPLLFQPVCGAYGLTNVYTDGIDPNNPSPEEPNTYGMEWNDGLCPVEIGLGAANGPLDDYNWHQLKVLYKNLWDEAPPLPVSYHRPCNNRTGIQWDGLTLYLGPGIEVLESKLDLPRLSVPAKGQRVNIYGIPIPEPSPTGETESDELETGFAIDVSNLAPTISSPDVAIPLEGGELVLEVRRTGGARSARTSTSSRDLPITFETDNLLGLGWDSNLAARAIISHAGGCGADDEPRATFTDSAGNAYLYQYHPGSHTFRAEVYDSQGNSALRATPSIITSPPTLILTLKHGTVYTYTKVGDFFPINTFANRKDEYYRLDNVEDRNQNKIQYHYPLATSLRCDYIYEAAHPERRIDIYYADKNGSGNDNGYDWGWRIDKITYPGGNGILHEIKYSYTNYTFDASLPYKSRVRALLTKVEYPAVQDRDTETQSRPSQHFNYEIATTLGPSIGGQTGPSACIVHAGIKEAWQNNDATVKTVFGYVLKDLPVGVYPALINPQQGLYDFSIVETEWQLTLHSARPPEGTSDTLFDIVGRTIETCDPGGCEEAEYHQTTEIRHVCGTAIEYEFSGVVRPIAEPLDPVDPVTQELAYWNPPGFATVIESVTRTTKAAPGGSVVAAVTFQYNNDLFGNLAHVTDASGNPTDYGYIDYGNPSDLAARKSNQPTVRTVNSTATTSYAYELDFNKLRSVTDAELKVTRYEFDDRGNRQYAIRESQSLGDSTAIFAYGPDGSLSQTTDPTGTVTLYARTFNPSDLDRYLTVTTIVDPGGPGALNLRTTQEFDILGRLRKEIPPEGHPAPPGPPNEAFATVYRYDAMGRLKQITRPATSHPDEPAQPASIESRYYYLTGSIYKATTNRLPGADPVTTTYTYDKMNRLTETRIHMRLDQQIDNLVDLVAKRHYNNMGLLEYEIDPKGHQVTFEYDQLLRLQSKSEDVTLDLDEQGQLDGQTAVRTLEETYTYQPNSGSGAFAYNLGWKPTRVESYRGYVTDTVYDAFYRPIRTVRRRADPPQDSTAPARDEGGGLLAEPVEEYEYNKVGNSIKKRIVISDGDAATAQETYTFYDDFHRPTIAVLDIDGDRDSGDPYDPASQWINDWTDFASHDPDDLVTKTAYDASDKVTQGSDPEGKVSDTLYDAAGRVEYSIGPTVFDAVTQADVRPRTKTVYDKNGQVKTTQGPYPDPDGDDASGILVGALYDERGRQVASVEDLDGDGIESAPGIPDSDDIITYTYYDLIGNVVKVKDPRGNVTLTAHDKANRAETVTLPAVLNGELETPVLENPVVHKHYDKNGNLELETDPRGKTTEFEYDELDRVVDKWDAAGSLEEVRTHTDYDENGNVLRLTLFNRVGETEDPQLTTYTLNPFDRQTGESLPGGRTYLKAYYRDGALKRSTDAKAQTVEYTCDRARRVTYSDHKNSAGAIQETRWFFDYDRNGRLRGVADRRATPNPAIDSSVYVYDALGRVTSETRRTEGQPLYTVLSKYDLNGNRRNVTYPKSTPRVVTMSYDGVGRLRSVEDTVSTAWYVHDKNGNVERVRSTTGSEESYLLQTQDTFDALNRLSTRSVTKNGDGTPRYRINPILYDLGGNIRSIEETLNGQNRTLSYDYDEQYRLLSESWVGHSYTYTYDLAGNRRTKTEIHGGPPATTSYTYNSRNELVSQAPPSQSPTTYEYDANGSLWKEYEGSGTTTYTWDVSNRLVCVAGPGKSLGGATYDYRTRRLTKTESSTTYFRYDGGLSFQELPSGGDTPTVELIHGPDLGGGIGGVVVEYRGTVRKYFACNQVGHTVATLNAFGNVASTNQYEAFGRIFSSWGEAINNRLANTKERDAGTGLYNHGFRYYDPNLGRYISRDPLGYADGLNCHVYVGSNPIGRVDPQGLGGRQVVRNDGVPSMCWSPRDRGYIVLVKESGRPDYYFVVVKPGDAKNPGMLDIAVQGARLSRPSEHPGASGGDVRASGLVQDRIQATAETASNVTTKAIEKVDEALEYYEPYDNLKTAVTDPKLLVLSILPGPSKPYKEGAEAVQDAVSKNVRKSSKGVPKGGAYSGIPDHPSVGPEKPFTQAQKRKILAENRANNDGVIRSDQSGAQAVQPQQHTRGVTPPGNEAHVDHIKPRSKGGSNSSSNAQVLTREENLRKGANE